MKKFIVIKTQFEGLHVWPDCSILSVDYLKNIHRHIFHIVMKWEVTENNREIEFISKKHEVDKFIRHTWENTPSTYSCEEFAERLIKLFNAAFVSVFEDNENGAEIYAN